MSNFMYLVVGVLYLVIMYDINMKLFTCNGSILHVLSSSNTMIDYNNQFQAIFLKDFAKQERNRMK